jgi:hypothetical protein
LNDPNQSNVYNINNVIRDANSHLRNKKKKYLKAKIEELETNSTIKNFRDLYGDIIDFKMFTMLELIQQKMRMVI